MLATRALCACHAWGFNLTPVFLFEIENLLALLPMPTLPGCGRASKPLEVRGATFASAPRLLWDSRDRRDWQVCVIACLSRKEFPAFETCGWNFMDEEEIIPPSYKHQTSNDALDMD